MTEDVIDNKHFRKVSQSVEQKKRAKDTIWITACLSEIAEEEVCV